MSTTTAPYGATLDISTTPRVPLSRLIRVELRKMIDTRAGMWLMITAAAISLLIVVIAGLTGKDADRTFGNFLAITVLPQAYLLPILGTLLVTQEWGQRTAMVTFTLEPHRSRVALAKVAAALLIGIAAFVLATVAAAGATALFDGSWGDVSTVEFAQIGLFALIKIIMGLTFGLLILNSAGAIVASLLLPIAFSIVADLWSFLKDKAEWLDLNITAGLLLEPESLTGQEWAQLAVTSVIWLVIPFSIGFWRMIRAEVK